MTESTYTIVSSAAAVQNLSQHSQHEKYLRGLGTAGPALPLANNPSGNRHMSTVRTVEDYKKYLLRYFQSVLSHLFVCLIEFGGFDSNGKSLSRHFTLTDENSLKSLKERENSPKGAASENCLDG